MTPFETAVMALFISIVSFWAGWVTRGDFEHPEMMRWDDGND